MAETVEKKVAVSLEAKIEGYLSNLVTAQQATKASTEAIVGEFSRVGNGINTLIGGVGILSGVLAGGAAFKGVVSTTVSWDSSTAKLAKTLGSTTETASILKVELTHLGIEQDVVAAAALRMAKTMNSNADAFTQLGVDAQKMRESGKSNLEIMMATIKAIGEYASGLDRNQAAMTIFGRSWGELQQLMKLTEDGFQKAEVRARELHLIVGPEGAQRAREYKESLADLDLVKTSLAHTAGTELLKALVEIGATMEGPSTKAAHIFAESVHEVHLGMRDLIRDHGDFVSQIDHAASVQTVNYLTLIMAARAAMSGNYSLIPTIFKVGYESGKAVRDNDPSADIDPQMQRAKYDKANKGAANYKHFTVPGEGGDDSALNRENQYVATYNRLQDERRKGAIEGNLALSETEKKLAEVGLKYQELIKLYPEHRAELERNMALDKEQIQNLAALKEAEEQRLKSAAYLNPRGELTEGQQGALDQSSMLTTWAARRDQQDNAAQQAGAAFMNRGEGNPEMERLNAERDAAMQNWAMMTDSFEEYERRKTLIERKYSADRLKIEENESRAKMMIAASTFGALATVADAFYVLSGNKSKVAFRAYQGLKSGETIISTASAAMKAFDDGNKVNYWVGVAQAAATVAMGTVQLATIWSASPDGNSYGSATGGGYYGNNSSSSAGGGYGYGGAASPSQLVTQPAPTQQTKDGDITIVLKGNLSSQFIEEHLIPGINEAGTRNVKIEYAR